MDHKNQILNDFATHVRNGMDVKNALDTAYEAGFAFAAVSLDPNYGKTKTNDDFDNEHRKRYGKAFTRAGQAADLLKKSNSAPVAPAPSGGPAFPAQFYDERATGMTLRDYFAAKAMQSAYLHFSADADITKHWSNDGLAESAYAMADAMLKVRESS